MAADSGGLPLVVARILAIITGVVVALVACELAARTYVGEPLLPLVPPEPYVDSAVLYQRSPTRLYELRPGVDQTVRHERIRIHINAGGMRDDREFARPKPAGMFRVVVLGDSFTFGGKVQVDETFPAVLERDLRRVAPSRPAEALNLAVPGYNTEQEMLLLKEEGLSYQPDLVIVNFVLNDAEMMQQLFPEKSRMPVSVRHILKRFELVQLCYAFSKRMSLAMDRKRPGRTEYRGELAPGSHGWERARTALAEMQRLTSESHAGLMVVVWPMFVDLNDDYPLRAKHMLVVDECLRLGIPVFDLLPTFQGKEASTLWASRDDHHPNAIALEMAAKAVLKELTDKALVPLRT